MIRIAICDDEKPMVERIADEVSRVCMKDKYRDTEVELFRTQSSGELMNYSSAKNIDILFLDIMMPGIDGVKLAEEFYTNHRNTLIVFVSSFENMVFYTMKFRPFRFVRKSKLDEELKSAIEDALDSIILSSETILIKKYTEVTSLNVYSISYVERIRNDTFFSLQGHGIQNKGKPKEI